MGIADAFPKQGLFLGKEPNFANQDFVFERYTQLVLENGETWIANNSTARGNPTFFAQGAFTFQSQTFTSITNSTVTTTTTATTTSVDPSSVRTNFANPSALVAANSATLGTGSVNFAVGSTQNIPFTIVTSSLYTDVSGRLAPSPGSRYQYEYDKPANVADITGAWVFNNLEKPAPQVTLQVSGTGSLSGRNATTGCAYSGALTPRPSGKNVFNVALTVTGCADAGDYAGVSYSFLREKVIIDGTSVPVLMLFAINTAKTRVVNLQMAR